MAGSRIRAGGIARVCLAALGVVTFTLGTCGVAQAAKPAPSDPQAAENPGAIPTDLTAENAYQAQLMAMATGTQVEDVSQRTGDAQVFASPDGMWVMRQWSATTQVQTGGDGDSAGDWAAVDLTLARDGDGMIRPSVYDGDLALAPGGAKTDVILTTTIRDTGVALKLLWDGSKLPAVRLDGARAVYSDVWPGVDFVVEVTPRGFEQFFVVKTRAAAIARAKDLHLMVAVEGGSLTEDSSGALRVVDASGGVVMEIPAADAWDAANDDLRVNPVLLPWSTEAHFPDPVNLDAVPLPASLKALMEHASTGVRVPVTRGVGVTMSSHARGSRVDLDVDEAWLADPGTEYPVVVDPLLWSPNTTYDTYVRSSSPTSNFGGSSELLLGTTTSGSIVYRSYLAFPTTNIKDYDIDHAYLYMWNSWSFTCSMVHWHAYWTAPPNSSSTWNNYPAFRSAAAMTSTDTHGYTSGGCAEYWSVMDITPLAQAWVSRIENEQGLFLTTGDETLNNRWKRFWSLDASSPNKPRIDYYYNTTPAAPTGVLIDDVPLTEHVTSSDARPSVGATVTDDDGGSVQALFTVKQGGVVIVDALRGEPVDSGGLSTATLPYALVPGVEYTIVVTATDTRLIGPAVTQVFDFTYTGSSTAPLEISADDDDEIGVAP